MGLVIDGLASPRHLWDYFRSESVTYLISNNNNNIYIRVLTVESFCSDDSICDVGLSIFKNNNIFKIVNFVYKTNLCSIDFVNELPCFIVSVKNHEKYYKWLLSTHIDYTIRLKKKSNENSMSISNINRIMIIWSFCKKRN